MLKYNINLHIILKCFWNKFQLSQNSGFLLGLSVEADKNIDFFKHYENILIRFSVVCAWYNLASKSMHETQWL
jgi:hypothetical protein